MNTIRLLWSISAVLLLAALVWLCVIFGWPATGIAVLFALLPDCALIGAFASPGRLKPSRVRFYNLLHAPVLALSLAAIGLILLAFLPTRPWILMIAGLAWLTHIAVDRAVGYGFRASDGSIVPVGEADPLRKQA